MLKVNFYPRAEDRLLKYAVIAARQDGRWVFCRHKARTTWECPGGHREPGEAIEAAARRELWEETGAAAFTLTPVCVYGVTQNGTETLGMLYTAEIAARGPLPPLEIAEVRLFDAPPTAPEQWTYPAIQPLLLAKVEEFLAQHR